MNVTHRPFWQRKGCSFRGVARLAEPPRVGAYQAVPVYAIMYNIRVPLSYVGTLRPKYILSLSLKRKYLTIGHLEP